MAGFISLYRDIKEHWIWEPERPRTKLEAWIDLLMLVNFSEGTHVVGNEIKPVLPGSQYITIRQLSKRWKWSITKVTGFLNLLKSDGMILLENNAKKKTLLTVVNWELYQVDKDRKKTEKRQRKDREKTLNNNENNENKEINIYSILLNIWNEQKIITHQEVNEEVQKAIDEAVKKHTKEKVIEAIQRYGKAYHDPEYFFSYKWSLLIFLKQKNGLPDFLDGGSKWEDYKAKKGKVQSPDKAQAPKNEFPIYEPPNLFD